MEGTTRKCSMMIAVVLGFLLIALIFLGLPTVAAVGTVDLTVELEAPAHINEGAVYLVRIAYYNLGSTSPPDAQLTVALPLDAEFITSTDRWGNPLPPDDSEGNVLSWSFDRPSCYTPLNANCGHILITLQADDDLPEGIQLETVAAVATTASETDLTNNEDSVVSAIGAMANSSKQVQARYGMPADVLTYTLTLERSPQTGADQGEWIMLSDTLPISHQVRFLGWQGDVTATIKDGHTLHWEGKVQVGQPVQLQFRMGIEEVVTPGTVISNVAMLRWGEQFMQLGPVTTVVTLPHGALALGPNQGGQVYHRYGMTLTVPPEVVTDTTRFQIRPLFTDTLPSDPPPRVLFAHRAFELNAFRFGHQVGQFSLPLTITLNQGDAEAPGLKRETLQWWTRSGPGEPWAVLDEPAYGMSGAADFCTTEVAQFALFGEGNHRLFVPVILRE